jgi:hypothetical protein
LEWKSVRGSEAHGVLIVVAIFFTPEHLRLLKSEEYRLGQLSESQAKHVPLSHPQQEALVGRDEKQP